MDAALQRAACALREVPRDLRPGDWIVFSAALALIAALWTAGSGGTAGERAVVRSGGSVVANLDLSRDRHLKVQGPLGESVVEVRGGRVRVAADPGPRQICVRRGWLQSAGDVAVCLPNRLSVEVAGRQRPYDSLNY